MEDSSPIPANWGKLSHKFMKSIILGIVDDICLSKKQAILKYATCKKTAQQLLNKNCDSHLLEAQLHSHQLTPFANNDSDMDVDDEDVKSNGSMAYASADPLSWRNIETLFGGNFKNNMSNQICHGKVLLQTFFSLCGYHSYFNMKNTIESLVAEEPIDKLYYHLRSRLRAEFWKDYEKNRNLLVRRCRMSDGERESLLNDGSLERFMLKFLLRNDPDLIRILGTYDVRIETIPLFYGFGLFQGEKKELNEAAKIIQEFHNTTKPFVLTFVMGIVNHWNILVAFKRTPEAKPLLIFLDSRNIEIMNIDEFEINEFVEQRDRDIRQLTGKPPLNSFFRKYVKHCLYDIRMLLGMLEDTLYYQKFEIRQLVVKRNIHNILKSFCMKFDDMIPQIEFDPNKSRQAMLRYRYNNLDASDFKTEMLEFLPFVLDCEADFSPLFRVTGTEAEEACLKLVDWLQNYHEPYHIRKAIAGTMNSYKNKIASEDCDLLLFWVLSVEFMIKSGLTRNFKSKHHTQTEWLEYMLVVLSDIKEVIQKAI